MPARPSTTHDALLADALATTGWCAVDDWLDAHAWRALADACRAHAAAGRLQPALVGRGAARREAPALRGDHTRWLDPADPVDALALRPLDALRDALNRALFLGLRRVEAHYARYPPGTAYARHVDRFRDDDARVVSAVAYLNAGWADDDGGALRIHPPDGGPPCDIAPRGGRLVVFRSDTIEHEVLATRRERLSIAAWLRRD
jgi:SM-20-related protein